MSSLFLKKLKNFFILLFSSSDAIRLEKYFFFTLIRLYDKTYDILDSILFFPPIF